MEITPAYDVNEMLKLDIANVTELNWIFQK